MLIVFALCPVPISYGLSLPLIGSFAEPAMNEYPALLMSPPPPPHEFRFRWKGRRRNFSRNSEPVAFHSEPSSSSAPLRPLKSQDCNILEYAKCSSRAPGAGGRAGGCGDCTQSSNKSRSLCAGRLPRPCPPTLPRSVRAEGGLLGRGSTVPKPRFP